MGIKFPCAHCGQRLNIKSDLAGKRGICPHCHAKIDIPSESVPKVKSPTTWAKAPKTGAAGGGGKNRSIDDSDETTFDPAVPRTIPSVAAIVPGATVGSSPVAPASNAPMQNVADPITEAPELRWYVMPEGSTDKYGPAPGDIMRGWVADGRVGVDSLVWREDWPDWLEAAKVFPQLVKTTAPQAVAPVVPTPAPSVAVYPNAMLSPQTRPAVAPAGIPSNPSPATFAPGVGMAPGAAAVGARVPVQPARPVAGPAVQPNFAAMPGNPLAGVAAQPNAPLIKVDEPVRHVGPAHEYIPSSKRSKTGSLIAIVVLAVAMLVLIPIVIWVLTRQ